MPRFLLVVFLSLLPVLCLAQQPVEVWTYHLTPPFKVNASQGLSQDFVDLLNNDPANAGRFRFQLTELPRKRLDLQLERSEEHTSELQSRENLVCRLLLEIINKKDSNWAEV